MSHRLSHRTRPASRNLQRLPLAVLCALAFAPAVPWAQTVAANNTANDEQSVTITGQKRLELLKDVPAAISAYSGQQLQQLGLNNTTELRFVAPSVNFTPSANARGEGFSVRGVGTATFSDSVEQSVGFVIDGVVVGRSGQASGDLLDVERIEVLRGPQGMLFGKNASAGLISVVTKKPKFGQTTGDFSATLAQHNEKKLQAVGNLPLGDSLAMRLALGSTQVDGNVKNIKTGEVLNNRDEQQLRAKLLWAASAKLDVYAIVEASDRNSLCCAWTARSAPTGTTFATLNAAAGIVPSSSNLQVASGLNGFFQNAQNRGASIEVNYDLGWATVTSLSAYRTWVSEDNNDPDLLPINILDRNTGRSELTQKTQELRLTSPSGGALEWVAGLYGYDQKNRTEADQAGTLAAGANILGTALNTTTTNTAKAVFGQASWRLSPLFKLTGGARYTRDAVALDFLQFKSPTAVASIPGRYVGAIAGETSKNNVSWRVTGQADFSRDHLGYVTAARGFKGPGINTLGVASNSLEVIQPEVPRTVEAGARTSLWGGAVQFNVAVFKTQFENFQAQIFDQNVSPGRFRVTNAGQLDTQGLEFEMTAKPTRALSLTASAALMKAQYGDFKNIACYTGQTILPFGTLRSSPRECIRSGAAATATATTEGTGNDLANAPRSSVNLLARYETTLAGLKVSGQGNYAWRDKVNFSAAGDPNLVQAAYGLFGAAVGVGAADGQWTLTLFGKNLANKNFATNVISQPVLNAVGVSSQFVSLDARRSIGATLNLRFGK